MIVVTTVLIHSIPFINTHKAAVIIKYTKYTKYKEQKIYKIKIKTVINLMTSGWLLFLRVTQEKKSGCIFLNTV